MPGTHVARGDVERGHELASRTRKSVGKNSGLNRFEFDCLYDIYEIFGRMFNFRMTIYALGAVYLAICILYIYIYS